MGRRLSMAARRELIESAGRRYRSASTSRAEKAATLGFGGLTGFHRKHAIGVLCKEPGPRRQVRGQDCLYDEAVGQALVVLWRPATGSVVSGLRF